MNKVDCAQFFFSFGDDILDDVCKIINGKRKQILFRDRFDILNRYSKVNWIDGGISLSYSNKTFADCCESRSKELLDLDKPINILYSGGVDSCALVASFFDSKERTRVFGTNRSIIENPKFYEKFKDILDFHIISEEENLIKEVCNYDGLIVCGHTADQLFGHAKFSLDDSVISLSNVSYKDTIKILIENGDIWNFSNNYDDVISCLEEYVEKTKFPVKTLKELTHLLNFGLKWSFIANHITFDVKMVDRKRDCISFFDTQDFQNWCFSNFKEINSLKFNSKDQKNYKKTMKDYVKEKIKYSIDDIGKGKSWLFESHTLNPYNTICVKTDKDYVFYDMIDNFYLDKDEKNRYNLFSNLIKSEYYK